MRQLDACSPLRSLSAHKLPVAVWILIVAQLDYSGCKSLEACSRDVSDLVRRITTAHPEIARVRFKETHPDEAALSHLFRQVARRGLGPSATLKVHPLFACVDWQPMATFEQLMVVRDSQGRKLAQPVELASLPAQHEAATSPAVADAVLRVDLRMAFAESTAPNPPRDIITSGSRVVSVGAVFRAWCAIAATSWWHEDEQTVAVPPGGQDMAWGQRLWLATLDPRALVRRTLSISCPPGRDGRKTPAFMLTCEPSIRSSDDRRWQMDCPKPSRASSAINLARQRFLLTNLRGPPLAFLPFPEDWWQGIPETTAKETGQQSQGRLGLQGRTPSS